MMPAPAVARADRAAAASVLAAGDALGDCEILASLGRGMGGSISRATGGLTGRSLPRCCPPLLPTMAAVSRGSTAKRAAPPLSTTRTCAPSLPWLRSAGVEQLPRCGAFRNSFARGYASPPCPRSECQPSPAGVSDGSDRACDHRRLSAPSPRCKTSLGFTTFRRRCPRFTGFRNRIRATWFARGCPLAPLPEQAPSQSTATRCSGEVRTRQRLPTHGGAEARDRASADSVGAEVLRNRGASPTVGELTHRQANAPIRHAFLYVQPIETIDAETVVGALSQPARRLLVLRAVRNSR